MIGIYMDEAGTTHGSEVTVVASIMADEPRRMAAEYVFGEAVNDHVPSFFKPNFIFHASDIWNEKRYREWVEDGVGREWNFKDRLRFIQEVMSIPRIVGAPITVSAVWRSAKLREYVASIQGESDFIHRMSNEEFDHMIARLGCVQHADKMLKYAHEKSIVYAEKLPKYEPRHIGAFKRARMSDQAFVVPAKQQRRTEREKRLGLRPKPYVADLNFIDDMVFVDRNNKMVQIADAVAFGLRRWLSDLKGGAEFAWCIGRNALNRGDWGPPMGRSNLNWVYATWLR